MAPDAPERVAATLRSGYVAEGPRVKEFEARLCGAQGWPRALALNSGTAALQLATHLAGVRGWRWRVITTPQTCTATNTALLAAGAEIVWCDIDPRTGNLDPDALLLLAHEYGSTVAAVVAVDWAGVPCDWAAITAIAREHGWKTIRDAAHAFGSPYEPDVDFTCYSFQAIKHLTTGDGGALVCRHPGDHDRGKLLRWFGLDRGVPREQQCVNEAGWKYHMNDIAATIGLANLPWQADLLAAHRTHAAQLVDEVGPLYRGGPAPAAAWWFLPLHVANPELVRRKLAVLGVDASQVHTRNDVMPGFPRATRPLPGVDEFAARHLGVPCGWWLGEHDVRRVADAVRRCA